MYFHSVSDARVPDGAAAKADTANAAVNEAKASLLIFKEMI